MADQTPPTTDQTPPTTDQAPPAANDQPSDSSIRVSPVSRGRMRPRGSRREVLAWYLIRISGLMLFVLALAHFSILHFVYDPANQTAAFIADQRWNNIFWRVFDWLLLMSVLVHAFLGVRTVVLDYIHRPASREFTLALLYTTAILLFIIGTQVVLTLPSPTGGM